MFMFRACIFLFLTIPATSFGSCWVDVYTDKEEDIYLNYCSIVQVGKYKKAWVRWVYADNKQTSNSPSKEYDETKQLTYFDCDLRSSSVVKVIYYSPEPENKVVDNWSKPFKSSELQDEVPDSLGDAILKAACRKYKK